MTQPEHEEYAPPDPPPRCTFCERNDRKLWPADVIPSWTAQTREVIKGDFCSMKCFVDWSDWLETEHGVVDVRIRRKQGEVV